MKKSSFTRAACCRLQPTRVGDCRQGVSTAAVGDRALNRLISLENRLGITWAWSRYTMEMPLKYTGPHRWNTANCVAPNFGGKVSYMAEGKRVLATSIACKCCAMDFCVKIYDFVIFIHFVHSKSIKKYRLCQALASVINRQ